MVFGIISLLVVVIFLIVIIKGLFYLSEQLCSLCDQLREIYNNLPNVLECNKAKEKLIETKKNKKDCAAEFLKKLDYYSRVSMAGNFSYMRINKENMPRHKALDREPEEEIEMIFYGDGEGEIEYFTEEICEAGCIIRFKKKTMNESLCFDNFDNIPRYDPQKSSGVIHLVNQNILEENPTDGRYIMWFEIYEDISEFEKYKSLISSDKKISIEVQGDIFKEKNWKEEHGWVTGYRIHIED